MASPLSIVGKSVPKRDAYAKVTGEAKYTSDIQLPGMLRARILRSPYAHARIVRLDTSRAAALPGVAAVVSRLNVPERFYVQSEYVATAPRGVSAADQCLFDATVRFAGQPVAAVAAVDLETADRALELIDVDYEELPAVIDVEAALKPGAPVVNDRMGADNLALHLPFHHGDVEAGLAAADFVIERRFRTSKQKQAQTEPFACVASYDRNGLLTVWTPCQTPHPLKKILAMLFELPMSSVRVVTPHIGGAFGGRTGVGPEPYAVALAVAARRPVKLEFTRAEDFYGTESRHPMVLDVKVGAKRDGTLTAMHMKAYVNAGAYVTQSVEVTAVAGVFFLRLYRCENRWFDGYVAYTNTPVSGGYRGYGGPQAYWALEQVLDEVAERCGIDPLELRTRLALRVGDIDPATGLEVMTSGLAECVRRGAQAIGWERRGRRRREGPWVHGLGAAICIWVSGVGCMGDTLTEGSAATVRLNLDGTVDVLVGTTDLGTGIGTTLAQIAAERLGVPFGAVRVILGDTDLTPFDIGAHASRSLFHGGHAVIAAADDARRQILQIAGALLEAHVDDLEIVDGRVRPRGVPDRALALGDVALAAYRRTTEVRGRGATHQTNNVPFAAHFVEVAVNTETGQVRVVRYVAAHDVGRAIHPVIVEGQLEGGIFHGLGYALSEDMVIDPETGSTLNASFMDYKFLSAADVPDITTILVEAPDPEGPYGAKSVGEISLPPVAPAIANAIYDAVGVRLSDLPMTPPRVLCALREAGERSRGLRRA